MIWTYCAETSSIRFNSSCSVHSYRLIENKDLPWKPNWDKIPQSRGFSWAIRSHPFFFFFIRLFKKSSIFHYQCSPTNRCSSLAGVVLQLITLRLALAWHLSGTNSNITHKQSGGQCMSGIKCTNLLQVSSDTREVNMLI